LLTLVAPRQTGAARDTLHRFGFSGATDGVSGERSAGRGVSGVPQ